MTEDQIEEVASYLCGVPHDHVGLRCSLIHPHGGFHQAIENHQDGCYTLHRWDRIEGETRPYGEEEE